MKPEEQRIKIAEACGWMRTTRLGKDVLYDPSGGHVLIADAHNHLPDYLNDLNAMHEAEKVLTERQAWVYRDILSDIVIAQQGPRGAVKSTDFQYGATAAQRAESFLKTIGKWTP